MKVGIIVNAVLFGIFFQFSCRDTSLMGVNPPEDSSVLEKPTPSPLLYSEQKEMPRWSGKTASFFIDWNANALTVTPQTDKTKSQDIFETMTSQMFDGFTKRDSNLNCHYKNGDCKAEKRFRLLSVFGHYVTFEEASLIDDGQSPDFEERRLSTIDLNRLNRRFYKQGEYSHDNVSTGTESPFVRIDELFDSKEVVSALVADDDVKNALINSGIDYQGKTVAGLISDIQRTEGGACPLFRGDRFQLCAEILTNFAIVKLIGDDKALVELKAWSYGAYSRDETVSIFLTLSFPEEIRQDLENSAADTSKGFLKQYADAHFSTLFSKVSMRFE